MAVYYRRNQVPATILLLDGSASLLAVAVAVAAAAAAEVVPHVLQVLSCWDGPVE